MPGRPIRRWPTGTTTPGVFTAMIGFEWTAIGGYNLHRNVLFRGDASVANQTLPFSQFDSKNPEDLWSYMAEFEQRTGSEVLAIPHNGNLSNGRMFTVESFDGKPLTKELAARAHPVRAAHRGHPDQGRRRIPPYPVTQ